MPLEAATKKSIVETNRRSDKDTGSPEVQVAILSERIKDMGEHLKSHPKDYAGLRGLTMMVSKRGRLLKYLAANERERYQALIQRLGLRK